MNRTRRAVVAGVAVVLVGAAVAFAVDRVWFGPPDLSVGSHHHVTLTFRPPTRAAGEVYGTWTVDYAGYRWCSDPPPFGAGPVSGTLTIDPEPTTTWMTGERSATFRTTHATVALGGIPARFAPSPVCQ